MPGQIKRGGSLSSWYSVQVSRLTAPRVVLLGDAAHAVSAAFGQGVNSALEVSFCPHSFSCADSLMYFDMYLQLRACKLASCMFAALRIVR